MRIGLLLADATLSGGDAGSRLRSACDLALALRAIPFVEQVCLVGDRAAAPPAPRVPAAYQLPLLTAAQAEAELDIAIQVDAVLPPTWFARFDARGGVIIHLQIEPLPAALVEPSLFARPALPLAPPETRETWIYSGDSAQRFLAAGLYRHPVVELPFVYSDLWVAATAGLPVRPTRGAADAAPVSGRAAKLWILTSNDRVGSMATLPLLACDLLARKNPHPIGSVALASAAHLTAQPTFQALVASCRSLGSNVVATDMRVADAALAEPGPFVVHALGSQIEAAWLDILVRGERLIHNCASLRNVGWFYSGEDPAEAASAIRAAIEAPADDVVLRQACLTRIIGDFAPTSTAVQSAYARRLLHVCPGIRRPARAAGWA